MKTYKYLYEGDSIVVEQNIDGYGNIFAGNDEIAITRKKPNSKKYILSETYYGKNGDLADNVEKVAVTHYKPELNGLYYLDKELNAIGEVVIDSLSK